jgi:hypothetical protein
VGRGLVTFDPGQATRYLPKDEMNDPRNGELSRLLRAVARGRSYERHAADSENRLSGEHHRLEPDGRWDLGLVWPFTDC